MEGSSVVHEDAAPLLVFPRDEGVHPGLPHEWWYFCAHVTDSDERRYGVMVCFFNNGKLYLGVTDEQQGEHCAEIVKGGFRAAHDRLAVSIDGNWWHEEDSRRYVLHAAHGALSVELAMQALKLPLLVGGGRVPMGLGGVSHYYSQTRLQVKGRLSMRGEEHAVSGTGWIDRQWGNWNFDGLGGWEWFGIQLEDGTDILLCEVLDPRSGMAITSMVEVMDADGQQETLTSYELDRLGTWQCPKSGETFSHGWRLRLPARNTDFEIVPTVAAQLLHKGLWEGSCRVRGKSSGEDILGRAYVELLHQPRPNAIIRLARCMASLTRLPEWVSKLQLVFMAALTLLLFETQDVEFVSPLVVLAVYMGFISSYGYALNSYVDRHQDREAGKPETLVFLSDRCIRLAILAFAAVSLVLPFLAADVWVAGVGIATFGLATAYSIKPLRLKERGILGVIAAAVVQRPMPFLLFAMAVGLITPLTWYLLGHLTMLGLSGIVTHQLTDFARDRRVGVKTWAAVVGFPRARKAAGVLILLTIASLAVPVPLLGIRDGMAVTAVVAVLSTVPMVQSFRGLMRKEPLVV